MIVKTFIIVSMFYLFSIFYIFKNVKIDNNNNIIIIPNNNIIIILPNIDDNLKIFYSLYTIPYLQTIKQNNISLKFSE
jgi:hypothetical protein